MVRLSYFLTHSLFQISVCSGSCLEPKSVSNRNRNSEMEKGRDVQLLTSLLPQPVDSPSAETKPVGSGSYLAADRQVN